MSYRFRFALYIFNIFKIMKYPEGFAICIKLVKKIAQLKFKYTSN